MKHLEDSLILRMQRLPMENSGDLKPLSLVESMFLLGLHLQLLLLLSPVMDEEPLLLIPTSTKPLLSPFQTQQIAAQGYGSFAMPPQTGVGNPITYWSQNGSPTIMSTQPLFANGTPANILNIGTTGSSISFNNETRAAIYTAPTNPFNTDGRDITIVAFRDTIISGSSTLNTLPVNSIIPIFAPSGNILVITQSNMTLRDNAVVSASENVDLVCDNQAPAPPQIGPGAFSIDATSFINSDNGYIRVYTARQAQNVIDPLAEFISAGTSYFFVPGQLFVDTNQEKWCTYYPDGDQGIPFKIFYKPCLETITQEAMIILTESHDYLN